MAGRGERPPVEMGARAETPPTRQTERQRRIERYAQEILDLRHRARDADKTMPTVHDAITRILDRHNIEEPGRQELFKDIATRLGQIGAEARQKRRTEAATRKTQQAVDDALARQLEDEARAGATWKEVDIEE